jgi:hypothetical protein
MHRPCCRTRWLTSLRDEWWVVVFLGSIITSHVDSVQRLRDDKAETWYLEYEVMFTIIWNSHGSHIVDKPPNDTKTNSDYSMTKIISLLKQTIFLWRRVAHQKRLVIHIDTCSVHASRASTSWLKEHGICRIPHLSYSLELASREFYLFLIIKEKLERIQVRQEDQFLSACKRF